MPTFIPITGTGKVGFFASLSEEQKITCLNGAAARIEGAHDYAAEMLNEYILYHNCHVLSVAFIRPFLSLPFYPCAAPSPLPPPPLRHPGFDYPSSVEWITMYRVGP